MGYAFGENYRGEEIGYGVQTACTEPGCEKEIDRGLACTCGGMEGHDGERGCGRAFCEGHLHTVLREDMDDDYDPNDDEEPTDPVCGHCLARIEAEKPTGKDDNSWTADESEV